MNWKPSVHALVFCQGMFYYTIGNIRPELRSSQRAVQLIACAYSAHIERYGLECILEPFINDVNALAKVRHFVWWECNC